LATANIILKKLESVNLLLAAQKSISNTQDSAVDEQRYQLSQGLKADGTYQPNYSPRSVSVYGKTPGPIKLYDTGAFYRGLKVEVTGDLFKLYSIDEKNDYLDGLYQPLGLGVYARTNYIRTLQPEFVKQVKEYLK
jgi:hypothetical protein